MPKFEIYQDTKQNYRWRLVAANGKIIADSAEGYTTRQACEEGIRLVKEYAPSAPVVEG
ncbi:MAG: DUF1508 domain-containing protein [Chloroflexi bacterium]|nr:DUF1508 domain-containing protein [Chloroflexota bacterium]